MENEMKAYSLKEISQWQKDKAKIFLPSLQRGFVWKPNQIEALWDSIFRGYPIGAIMMSVDENDNRFLLDGQQRCTSIALGHFNPFEKNLVKFLSLKEYIPSVWIDLASKEKSNSQQFVFRCLTKSHPWGYQLKNNGSPLAMVDRRNALGFFKSNNPDIESYIELNSDSINPWDAHFPIPLAFILEIEILEYETFKKSLLQKTRDLKIKTKHSNNEYVNFNEINDSDLKKLFIGFQQYKSLHIPEISIKSNLLKDDDDGVSESQDPSLFVRLNSAGTRITGEELIYSIFKAKFPSVKDLVESVGSTYIAPSKVINLFARISICKQGNYSNYPKDVSIQNFRKKILEDDFKEKLQTFIGNDTFSPAKELINNAIELISKTQERFPKILLKQTVASNSDLFFVLLAYLDKHKYSTISSEEKNKIASSYVYILWFHKDIKSAINRLFKLLFTEENLSWSNALSILIQENLILPIIEPQLLRNQLNLIVVENQIDSDHITTIKDKNLFLDEIKTKLFFDEKDETRFIENWNLLINRIYSNKSLLLYAQRDYMNLKFKEFNQFENIEDTNRPWDWDHIYPNSWVYNNKGINPLVRNWVNCIGNFRALSYDDNRSESNNVSPKERFENDSNKKDSFIIDSDFEFWNKIDGSFYRVTNDENQVKVFLSAVVIRMVNIYEEWYENYYLNIS